MSNLLSQSQRSLLFQESDPTTNQPIVWKVCGPEKNTIGDLVNEFEICQSVAINGIRQVVRRGFYQNKEGFAYRFFDGISLKTYCAGKALSVEQTLTLAIQLVSILKQLHQEGVAHLRLNSHHVLYQPKTGAIQLIDLSLASRQHISKALDFQDWGQELAYMAPEQAGRLNQAPDNRSDLYAVGIILYELLTGQLPFHDDDIAKLVHYHLVQLPTPPQQVNPLIPATLSAIVEKLLAKKADDRYQTAHGLWQDLRCCLDDYTQGRPISLNELGEFDQSERLRFSAKLYGRDTILRQLLEGFKQGVVGDNRLYIVSGDPGTGKSALIQHLRQVVQSQDGLLLTASCEPPQLQLPNLPFVNGLRELAATILSRSIRNQHDWRAILQAAVGDQATDLIRLVPEFRWILESESPSEIRDNRPQEPAEVPYLFQHILRGLATLSYPIVLVADDAQWGDDLFWKTLMTISNDPLITQLRIVATYQTPADDESLQAHLQELSSTVETVEFIQLANLAEPEVRALVADSLQTDQVDELSRMAFTKTAGNPLFLRQFLTTLFGEKTLWFDPDRAGWLWDKTLLVGSSPTDNVVEQVIATLGQVSTSQTQVLRQAACLGTDFDSAILAELLTSTEPALGPVLAELVAGNWLNELPKGYCFSNERIRQAVYESIPATEKSTLHYGIATLLSARRQANDTTITTQELARHFTLGVEQMPAEDRFGVVELNLKAGLDAREDSDFRRAYHFFVCGIGVLNELDWEHQYETVLTLYNQATEVGMIIGVYDEAEQWLQESLRRARTIDDRLKAHEIKLNQLTKNHQFAETIAHLLAVLEEIGHPVRRHPSKGLILWELLRVNWYLRNKKIADIPKMKLMEDERAKAFQKLGVNSSSSIFGHAPDIAPIINFRGVQFSLKYGLSVYSPVTYVSFGTIQLFLGRTKQGYEFGKMALALTDQLQAEEVRAKVMVIFYGFISFWQDSLRQSIEPMLQAYVIGCQNGDLLYAAFALSFHSTIRLHVGDNLTELLPVMTKDCQTILDMKQGLVYMVAEIQRQLVVRLVRETDEPLPGEGELLDEAALLKKLDELGDQATKFYFNYYKMVFACLLNQYTVSFEASERASQFEDNTTSRQTIYPSFLLFSTIAYIKQAQQTKLPAETRTLQQKIARKVKKMQLFAKEAPQNYEHKYELLRALQNEQKAPNETTTTHYQAAVRLAQINNYTHEEALAREHFAYFLLRTGQTEYGGWMLQKAYQAFQKWGATAKCRQLVVTYPQLVSELATTGKEITIASLQDRYDLTTIIHANQTLSSENNLEGLLKRLIEIVIQNASATNVVILIKGPDQQLVPKAVGTNQSVHLLTDEEARAGLLFPETVVTYVSRTMVPFVSANVSEESRFSADAYLLATHPISVCCLPIVAQNILLGVLYLENNLAEGAFDAKRVDFFTTISSQLAISLDNVFLYEDMEQKVQQRTIDLEKSLANLKAAQAQLIQAEKMASLGELTAGVAHEIQNPLNFVKNFSEVSVELVDELVEEQQKPDRDTELEADIMSDLKQNLQKISQHGNRAAAIVKGMLEHSRASTGKIQPTDLNALADEYLRLSYQGLRATDKSFNASLITNFDSQLKPVNAVPQDIGRVLLNLFNNAFYAVRQRQGQETADYQPCVWVSTRSSNGLVEVQVRDNGTGIPKSVMTKIFQPFFTTKPTGQGTGLGLSLSYDIITKAHGGVIEVDSVEGEGTTFTIRLPG